MLQQWGLLYHPEQYLVHRGSFLATLAAAYRHCRSVQARASTRQREVAQLDSKNQRQLQGVQHLLQQVSVAEQRSAQLEAATYSSPSAGAEAATFEGYYHPLQPDLLVTPGTLVVLLHVTLIKFWCMHSPGSSSLRTNPPVQAKGMPLFRYGQMFKEAALVRGYKDDWETHASLYLQGLLDQQLRRLYDDSLLQPAARQPTCLRDVVAEVERISELLLKRLGDAANVGPATAMKAFVEKLQLTSPEALCQPGTSSDPTVLGMPAATAGATTGSAPPREWLAAVWPNSSGSEEQLLDAPCCIHLASAGRKHSLRECSFLKRLWSKFAATPAAAQMAIQQYHADRLSRATATVPIASVQPWQLPSSCSYSWEPSYEDPTEQQLEAAAMNAASAASTTTARHPQHAPFAAAYAAAATPPVAPLQRYPPQAAAPAADVDLLDMSDLEVTTNLIAAAAMHRASRGAHGVDLNTGRAMVRNGQSAMLKRDPAVLQAYHQAMAMAPIPTDPLPPVCVETPCPDCGRQQGHNNSICFARYPDLAPAGWMGPCIMDGDLARATYLTHVGLRKPGSRHAEAVAAQLVRASPANANRSVAALGQLSVALAVPTATSCPPTMPPQATPQQLSAAAYAAAHPSWQQPGNESEEDEEPHRYSACMALPRSFPVLDQLTALQREQPRVPNTLPPTSSQQVQQHLEQAATAGEPNMQLHAIVQGLQHALVQLEQLQAARRLADQRHRQLEGVLSKHWHTTLPPALSPEPLAAASEDRAVPTPVVDSPSTHHLPDDEAEELWQQAMGDQQPTLLPPVTPAPLAPVAESAELTASSDQPANVPASAAAPTAEPLPPSRDVQRARLLVKQMLSDPTVMDQPMYQDARRGMRVCTADGQPCPLVNSDPAFDSGCLLPCIALADVQAAGLPWVEAPDLVAVTLANGTEGSALGVTEPFKVMIRPASSEPKTTWVTALVLPGSPCVGVSLLLGKAWMKQYGIVINHAQNVLHYRSDSGAAQRMKLKLPAATTPVVTAVATRLPAASSVPSLSPALAAAPASPPAAMATGSGHSSRSELLPGCSNRRMSGSVCTPPYLQPGAHSPRASARPAFTRLLCRSTRPLQHSVVPAAAAGGASRSATAPHPAVPDTKAATSSSYSAPKGYYAGEFNPLTDLDPLGDQPPLLEEDAVKDPDHGWHYGAQLTAAQRQQLQQLLLNHLEAFAFTSEQLVGYTGSDGQFPGVEIHLKPGVESVYEDERRYGPRHMAVQDPKCQELFKLGWIREVPTTNFFRC